MKSNVNFWSLPVIAGIGIGVPLTTAYILRVINPGLSFMLVIVAMIVLGILGFMLVGSTKKAKEEAKE